MQISEKDKQRILDASEGKLLEVIGDFSPIHKSGSGYVTVCPNCKAERGLTIEPVKKGGIFKCFKCNQVGGKSPLDYLMKGQDKTFVESLMYLAERFSVVLIPDEPIKIRKKDKPKPQRGSAPDSFCAKMLTESGLTPEDTTIPLIEIDKNTTLENVKTFCSGSVDDKGKRIEGDDCIIEYYTLDEKPVMYEFKVGRSQVVERRHYFRVRWQHPHEHKDKSGKDTKYKSPYGSGTPIYIPQRIREAYRNEKVITRLFIQEGEKKAEKACKHGMMSVGISGIQNIAMNGALPEDLIRIIQVCKVKEVCFILDADWNDLSQNIKINEPVDTRPRNFFYAVKNYKEYMRTLVNRNLYVEIYFGHVIPNGKDKGVDDLLTKTLFGKEGELLADIDHLINTKDLKGQFLQLHKITSISDQKLEEFWCINSAKKFADRHLEELKHLPEFMIGKHKWRFNEKLQLESAQPIESDEQFWEETRKLRRDNSEYTEISFNYVHSRRFLQNRGFGRFRLLSGAVAFMRIQSPTVRLIDTSDAKDFLFDFIEENCSEAINNAISKGISQYVGPDKLDRLRFIAPSFLNPERGVQYFYFKQSCWKVSANAIEELDYSQITHHIWHDQKKEFPASKVPELIQIERNDKGQFSYQITPEGMKCHFLRFLENTSKFTWRKERMIAAGDNSVSISKDESYENIVHFVSKLCAIGYLIMEYKDPSVAKAVCAMDGKQSAVGDSNGRSGKSLVGELLKKCLKTAAVNGKKRDIDTDNFLWNDVDESTRAVFIDDVRQGYVFEDLFFNITGDWSVNYKGGRRMTIPFDTSPKIYLTTNHALKGDDDSHKDRQWKIAFCDFYNSQHKPIDDFGLRFFSDWDYDQWCLCWNMVAMCVQMYLKFGVVEAPGERLEQRQLRQEVTEDFLAWADEYYSAAEHMNVKIPRKDLNDHFFNQCPGQRKFVSSTEFKKKFVKYCKLRGYIFNPNRFDRVTGKPIYFDSDGRADIDDKSGGVEYFTIGDKNFTSDEVVLNTELLPNEPTDGSNVIPF